MKNPEVLYNQYRNKIYNLAFRMTGDREDADDITQETFIQAFKSFHKFKGESQVYTWLYKIAVNKCFRVLKKKNRTSFLSLQHLINHAGSPVSDEVSETEKMNYINQVKDGCLSGLLRCLSLQQRFAFILNILLGLPVTQVAGIIDKSENATRILVHRSKQNIKHFLCSNCSLYDSKNSCRCDNLINFSLKHGWIGADNKENDTLQIESEIKELKSVVGLYRTLPEKIPGEKLEGHIQKLFENRKDLLILNDKKVK